MSSLRLSGMGGAMAYTATALVLLFVLAPLLIAVAISFSGAPFVSFPPTDLTFRWYVAVLQDREFLGSLSFSFTLAIGATLFALLLGVPAALALHHSHFAGKDFIQSFLLSPLVFPVLITGLALLKFFSGLGMYNPMVNLILAHTLITLPYVVRTVTASLQLVDPSLGEAARTLGANQWRAFRRVTVPQILPGVSAGALFAFMMSLDNFPVSIWLADTQNNPLPVLLFQRITRMFDPSVAAMSTLMILLSAAAVILLEKLVGLRKAMGI